MGKVFLIPHSDISNSNERRMVEEKGNAWRFVFSCFVLGCERYHAHPLKDGSAYRWGAL